MFHFCIFGISSACYGIVQVPTGPWFCRKCESQERAARVVSHMVNFFFFHDKWENFWCDRFVVQTDHHNKPHSNPWGNLLFSDALRGTCFSMLVWQIIRKKQQNQCTMTEKKIDFHTDLPTTFVSMQAGFFLKCAIALCPFTFAWLSLLDPYIL